MAKKSFQDDFILFFMFITVALQITTLSLLLFTKVRGNKDKYPKASQCHYLDNGALKTDQITVLYKDVLLLINNIYKSAYLDERNGDVKLRTVFIILGPILFLSLTLLLLISHFLIKNQIISIILSGLLILVSLYVTISNCKSDYPLEDIQFGEDHCAEYFHIFYNNMATGSTINELVIIRLLNMLITILFSAFYFIYVLK